MPGPIDGLRNALLTSKIIMCLTHGEYDLMEPVNIVKVPANVYILEESGIGEVALTNGDRVIWETIQNRKELAKHLTTNTQYFLRDVKKENLDARKAMFNNASFKVYLPGDKIVNRTLILTPAEAKLWNWGYFEFGPGQAVEFPPDIVPDVQEGFETRRKRDEIMNRFGQTPAMQVLRENHYDGTYKDGYCTNADIMAQLSALAKGEPIVLFLSSCAVWSYDSGETLKNAKGEEPRIICERVQEILSFQQAHNQAYYALLGLKSLPNETIGVYNDKKELIKKYPIKELIEYYHGLNAEWGLNATSKRRKEEIVKIMREQLIHVDDKTYVPIYVFIKTYLKNYPAYVETSETQLLDTLRKRGCGGLKTFLKAYKQQEEALAALAPEEGEGEEEEEDASPVSRSSSGSESGNNAVEKAKITYQCFFTNGRAVQPFVNPATGNNKWTQYDMMVKKRAILEAACASKSNPYYLVDGEKKSMCDIIKKRGGAKARPRKTKRNRVYRRNTRKN